MPVTSDWKITGNIAFAEDNNPNTAVSQQYLEVLDASGKILAQFYPVGNYGGSTYLYGNKSVIASAPVTLFKWH
jgi:hypothetical protein